MANIKKPIPSDIKKVKALFERWRKTRKKRGQIPEHLWVKVIQLCSRHSSTKVAQILALNHGDLKRKMQKLQSKTS